MGMPRSDVEISGYRSNMLRKGPSERFKKNLERVLHRVTWDFVDWDLQVFGGFNITHRWIIYGHEKGNIVVWISAKGTGDLSKLIVNGLKRSTSQKDAAQTYQELLNAT